MTNIYEELKKQARDNKERWNKIETIISDMKKGLRAGEDLELWGDHLVECLELLVLNMKPTMDAEAELKALESSLFALDSVFKNKGK